MDLYKKKTLKFSNKEVSRDSRHAETLKARESSRFKRLSILRTLNEESINEDKSTEPAKFEGKKRPASRLEMLFKWKQEKEIKKELVKRNNKKPFYVGQSLKTSANMDTSFVPQSNIKFNTSKAAKSRLVTPVTSTKPAKDMNMSKKVTPITSSKPAKDMNMSKKVPSGTTFQSSRIPNHSRLNEAKSTTGAKISSVSTNKPNKTFGYSVVSSANQGTVPRIAKSNNKDLAAKKTPDVRNGVKINGNSQKTKSQESSLPKPNFSKPAKPVSRTGIPAFSSTSSKGIPVQKTQNRFLQKPASSINNKPLSAPISKLHEKTTPRLMGNTPTKKKECCSKMASNKQVDIKKSDDLKLVRKTEEKNKCIIDAESHEVESLFEQSIENIPDIFICDVSVINQPSVTRQPSFAPADFKFRPPAGLHEFTFDDDVFEEREAKFVSRTSTPSKPCKNSSSPPPKEIQVESEIVKDLNEISKNAAIEEKLTKESDVKVVIDSTDKDENLPTERANKSAINEHPILDSIDSPLDTVDTNKIKDIIAKQMELMNFDEEEFNDGENSFIRAEKEIDNDFNEVSKNSAVEEKLQKECDVKNVIDCTNKDENLPSERENEPAINELTLDDSQLDFIDEKKMKEIIARQVELMKLEEEELNDDYSLKEQDPDKCTEKKRLSAPSKRASMLKNILVLNSIAETSENDDSTTQTPSKYTKNNQNFGATPRRSQRLSKLAIMEDSPISGLTVTPRRSMRLHNIASKKCQFEERQIFSPVDECKLKTIPRRSIRLIDLNTPEKEINSPGKSNLTTDFQKLSLMDTENVNPQALIDLDYSPDPVPRSRSKKISLLYSPENIRKSMRKSIRGDLMSFSPSN